MSLKGLGLGMTDIFGKVQKVKGNNPIIKHERIIVTEELTYELYKKREKIKGIITDYGDSSSHVAILAKQSNLPAVIGTYQRSDRKATDILSNGDIIKLDSKKGAVHKLTEKELVGMLQRQFSIR